MFSCWFQGYHYYNCLFDYHYYNCLCVVCVRAMDGLPVTIRLLDPPLHEFLHDGDMDEVGCMGGWSTACTVAVLVLLLPP